MVFALLVGLFFVGVYALLRKAGPRWWVWSGGLTAVALAFFLLAAPAVIEPLFNEYRPVPPGHLPQPREKPFQLCLRQQRGRPAPHKNGLHAQVRGPKARLQLLQQGIHQRRELPRRRHVRVEIAVPALSRAERNVNVQPNVQEPLQPRKL